jgi:Rnl2 family RNA ligase
MDYLLTSVSCPFAEKPRDFREYPSIENPRKKVIEFLESQVIKNPTCQWVALEKIHGANFSFTSDGNIVNANKRSGPIAPNENFFCFEIILERHSKSVILIFNYLKDMDPNICSIQNFEKSLEDGMIRKQQRVIKRCKKVFIIQTLLIYDI